MKKDMDFFLFLPNSQKLLDTTKNSIIDAIKTTSKRSIQETAEVTGDLIGNKIAAKITNILKKSSTFTK